MKFYKLVNPSADSKTVASSCELYGFKNLQNLIRKLDKSSSGFMKNRTNLLMNNRKKRTLAQINDGLEPKDCDFIELMACPGGCLNGGGLLVPDDEESSNSKRRAESLVKLNRIYLEEFGKKNASKSDLNKVNGIGKQTSEYIKSKIISSYQPAHMNINYKVERRKEDEKTDDVDTSTAIFAAW